MPHVSPARTGAVALDLETGEVAYRLHPRLGLAPASTEKLALAYALLRELGPPYRLRTSVLASEPSGGVVRGDLVLKGAGDPTLSTPGVRELARRVRAAGVTRVTGAVVGDESLFDRARTGPGWKASYSLEEAAPLTALSVDEGRVRGRPVTDPALAAAAAFRSALVRAGVRVAGPARVGRGQGAELAALASPPLSVVLRRVCSQSDNFAAEVLLKHLGAVRAGRGTTAAGAAVVRRVLAGDAVPMTNVRIADGSGLSRLDRLTPEALVAILAAAWEEPALRRALLGSLAVAGRRGTLDDRLRTAPAAGRVVAKTGTTSAASALAGYVAGRWAFAVVQNGRPVSTWWARRAQDRFVTVLARE